MQTYNLLIALHERRSLIKHQLLLAVRSEIVFLSPAVALAMKVVSDKHKLHLEAVSVSSVTGEHHSGLGVNLLACLVVRSLCRDVGRSQYLTLLLPQLLDAETSVLHAIERVYHSCAAVNLG